MFECETRFYENNKDALLKNYRSKHIVIAKDKVFGAYDTVETAFSEAIKVFEPETFMIKFMSGQPEEDLQRFTSLVYV